jgi:pSer/pThr/pTyr-binding forkhead associated (FHA) protein
MSFLVIGKERFALQIGESVLGGDGEAAVPAEALLSLSPSIVITVVPGGPTMVRRLSSAQGVLVDRSVLGTEPRPLRHGSQLEIADVHIVYGEASLVGSTSPAEGSVSGKDTLLSVFDLPANQPTADTGGRVTDIYGGVRYDVPAEGLLIGRDPACQIILVSRQVSREHALVAPSLLGYIITDRSTNGVFVNGTRVHGTQLLRQRDVIRIGTAEFLFEADETTFEPALGADPAPAAYATGRDGDANLGGDSVRQSSRATDRRADTVEASLGIDGSAQWGTDERYPFPHRALVRADRTRSA